MSAKHNLVKTKTNTPGRIAMRRFLRNGLAMSGSVFILLVLFIALMGPFIRPDGTIHANDQHLSLSRLKPGTSIQTIRVKKTNTEEFGILKTWTNGGAPLPFSEIAVSTIIIKGDSVLVLPLAQNDMPEGKSGFLAQELISDPSSSSKGLSSTFIFTKTFLLGTDKYGRDLLSRLMAGSFISLSVGAIAVIISLLLGLTLGLIAGYYRGWLDNVIMWFTNVVLGHTHVDFSDGNHVCVWNRLLESVFSRRTHHVGRSCAHCTRPGAVSARKRICRSSARIGFFRSANYF
jgi:ABC-type dipeptide/oligopeptide/nickel transport system permease subunit